MQDEEITELKKIAVLNDLSGMGKCSLTAAIPVISVMGIQACPLPTAVLSAQTGFPSYYCDDYTDSYGCDYGRVEEDRFLSGWNLYRIFGRRTSGR